MYVGIYVGIWNSKFRQFFLKTMAYDSDSTDQTYYNH